MDEDGHNTGAWEKVVHDLAAMCGLNVPESKLETFSKLGSTFLVKRFDRNGNKRIHFASAMTLLGKTDGASAADGSSYLDLVSFIKANGCNPKNDLIELWKRIVFNMAVSNTDDHLRNHAFILHKNGWTLSPLYDVNPVPYGDELALNVNEDDNRISISLAMETAHHFGVKESDAQVMAQEITMIVRENWESLAKKYNISRGQLEDMRPAFSACYEEGYSSSIWCIKSRYILQKSPRFKSAGFSVFNEMAIPRLRHEGRAVPAPVLQR